MAESVVTVKPNNRRMVSDPRCCSFFLIKNSFIFL